MKETLKILYDIIAKSCDKCEADAIALSGGLDSTILAHLLKNKSPDAVAVIANDFVGVDLAYCQAASKALDLSLFIKHASTTDILNAAEETIKILGNFNDIEVRNSIVIYLALKWAKDRGHSSMVTGDGADELFAGYDFLLSKPIDQLESELDRIRRIMHFPAQSIGKNLGIMVESPFLDDEIIRFAKSTPVDMMVRHERNKIYGKWILRKAFEGYIPEQIVWRSKSPMQDGAGTSGLTGLFESIVPDDIFAQQREHVQKNDGISIRTKESLHYYTLYKRICKLHTFEDSGRSCRYCKFGLGESNFCRMCGAFPA